MFTYWDLDLRLRNPMLGTNPSSADVYHDFCVDKARKQIAEANKNHQKLLKSLKKFVGEGISVEKEIEELHGIIRNLQEQLGVREIIPETVEEIIAYSEDLEKRLSEKMDTQELYKSTVFLRTADGYPAISSHMILGNIKAILSTITNSLSPEAKKTGIFKSKVQLQEAMSMDLKFVDTILVASNDIVRDPLTKERTLCERPIRFNRMGVTQVALTASEMLPEGTIFNVIMRIRESSPLNSESVLCSIFNFGKNLGLGAWRGSSCYGQYDYRLTKIEDYKEVVTDADLGWR